MTAATVLNERSGYTTLICSESNLDGEQVLVASLPSGFGDCFLYEWQLEATSIATLIANPDTCHVFARIRVNGGSILDIAGSAQLLRTTTATQLGCSYKLLPRAVLWREGEVFEYRFPEIDTNAAPTVDTNVFFRVLRLRNLGG